jgi:hypothetical protein
MKGCRTHGADHRRSTCSPPNMFIDSKSMLSGCCQQASEPLTTPKRMRSSEGTFEADMCETIADLSTYRAACGRQDLIMVATQHGTHCSPTSTAPNCPNSCLRSSACVTSTKLGQHTHPCMSCCVRHRSVRHWEQVAFKEAGLALPGCSRGCYPRTYTKGMQQ